MTDPAGDDQSTGAGRWRRFLTFRWLLAAAVLVVLGLWLMSSISAYAADIDFGTVDHPYLIVFAFVRFDAVIPIFASESLLYTASTLVAQGTSDLEIWRLIAAGALGAIVGDSVLYWLARTVLRRFMAGRLAQVEQNENVGQALRLFEKRAGLLIVFGRFVPGVRFAVGATMGLTRYSYWRFLLWGSIGSLSWATFTCVSSYLVASVIDDRPLVSMLVSVVITTGLLAAVYKPLKEGWQD